MSQPKLSTISDTKVAFMQSMLTRPLSIVRPSRIEFGPGKVNVAGSWAAERGLENALVVSDAFNSTRISLLGLPGKVTVFSDVKPEPDIPNLEALMSIARAGEFDLIVGFGGGSAMDLAKLAAVLVGNSDKLQDIAGPNRAKPRTVKLAQIPTTSGTGSEAGIRALVTDPAVLNKVSVESTHMLADLAVVDPELTITVPPAVTAATGIDALAHCVEAYTSKRAHPMIDIYAREGIELVGKYLARAVADGSDIEARTALSLASLYGGFCLGPVNTTAGHAISYPLGTRHKIPHGLANALIFPHVLAFNETAEPEKTRDVAEKLGLSTKALFEDSYQFCADLGVEMRLSQHGVKQGDLGDMADEAFAIRRLLDYNPRDISRDEIFSIYEKAL